MRVWVYPGSFDPVTRGHTDIIERAARQCDKLIVAVLVNSSKAPAFSMEERMELLQIAVGDNPKVEIAGFSGLLVDFMKRCGATTIVKGLRAVADFEYEMQMAMLNKHMDDEMETLFMMTGNPYSYLSSSAVRELARNGVCVDDFVPEGTSARIAAKYSPSRA